MSVDKVKKKLTRINFNIQIQSSMNILFHSNNLFQDFYFKPKIAQMRLDDVME